MASDVNLFWLRDGDDLLLTVDDTDAACTRENKRRRVLTVDDTGAA